MKQERLIRPRRKITKDREVIEELVVEEPDAELLTDIDDLLHPITCTGTLRPVATNL